MTPPAPLLAVAPGLPELPLSTPVAVFAAVFTVMFVAPLLARAVQLPPVVVLVVAGVAVGPSGFGLVERTPSLAALATAGLLYLMFLAGLELDLDAFTEHRADAGVFGAATFVFPFVLGTAVALLLSFSWPAALLIGSCWASHTLLTYPVYRTRRVAGARPVVAAVGATIVTDTTALLVLVVVVASATGAFTVPFALTLLAGAGALTAVTLWLLPRVTRFVFSEVGIDPVARLVFVLATLFGVSMLAEIVGLEAILGAFLAGLALNRLVPNHSSLMRSLETLGEVLLVPAFLIATGMLVDPAALIAPRTLLVAGAFLAALVVGKAAAALLAGRLLRIGRIGVGAMVALSLPQAAATLAAVTVGIDAGLLEPSVLDPVVLVILVSCVGAGLLADRTAAQLTAPARTPRPGTNVVLAVASPESTTALGGFANRLVKADTGTLLTVSVADHPDRLAAARKVAEDAAHAAAADGGLEVTSAARLDRTVASGVLSAVTENAATLLVTGWTGRRSVRSRLLGDLMTELTERSTAPTLLVRPADPPRTVPTALHLIVDADLTADPTAWSTTLRVAVSLAGDAALHLHTAPSDTSRVHAAVAAHDPALAAKVEMVEHDGAPPTYLAGSLVLHAVRAGRNALDTPARTAARHRSATCAVLVV